jgi:site-specific recombinase XerD
LLELEIVNIDLENGTMLGGLKTDSGKHRIVPIHSMILHIILRYYDKKNKYLFTDKNGNKIKYDKYYQDFLKFKKENKENFDITHVIHETRHSVCSDLDKYGANKKCRDMILRTQKQRSWR